MTARPLALILLLAACAEVPTPSSPGTLIENHSATAADIKGLQRTNSGPFVRGSTETLSAVFDHATVRDVRWSATAGTLAAREQLVTWTLPDADTADLTLTVTTVDGRALVTTFTFAMVERTGHGGVKSASEALLASPMPVLDGGVAEISGGACEVEYDSSANVHLAFTSSTHPAVYYGKWNGTTWALELVDTLGFNTGGRVTPSYVSVKVDTAGTPHLLYIRDAQLFYATRSGANWLRERVDNATYPLSGTTRIALGLNALGRPSVVYTYAFSASYSRSVYATRTAASVWTAVLPPYSVGTIYETYNAGELLFDAAGTAFFPVTIYASNNNTYTAYLAAYNGTTVELRSVAGVGAGYPSWDTSMVSMAWAGSGRIVARTTAGVYDLTLASPMANTTFTFSATEANGAGDGDIAWNGRPVVLHHHAGGSMELVTPAATGASFWTWTQLGQSSGVSASVAVHPMTGVPSICYQASGRIMFQ
jgi:hypothetical protein